MNRPSPWKAHIERALAQSRIAYTHELADLLDKLMDYAFQAGRDVERKERKGK